MPGPSEGRAVFINCPFDSQYTVFLDAMVFTILRCGFAPRCALEIDDSANTRIAKILKIISECPLGIHDISRTELDRDNRLPRFNMPFELGLFIGARQFGSGQENKLCLILDKEKFRYQKFLSDIAGQDIRSHDEKPDVLIKIIRNFLQSHATGQKLSGGAAIKRQYDGFVSAKPRICAVLELDPEELTYLDQINLVAYYLQERV
jgi:hypothetical protein